MRSITLKRMTRVAIVCKPHREELARLLPDLIAWLRQHGYDPLLDREGGSTPRLRLRSIATSCPRIRRRS